MQVSEELERSREQHQIPLGTLYTVQQAKDITWNVRDHYRVYERSDRLLLLGSRAARYVRMVWSDVDRRLACKCPASHG